MFNLRHENVPFSIVVTDIINFSKTTEYRQDHATSNQETVEQKLMTKQVLTDVVMSCRLHVLALSFGKYDEMDEREKLKST